MILIFDLESLKISRRILAHEGRIFCLSWSPDVIASGGQDRFARIWDLGSTELVHETKEVLGVRAVTWSPDGKMLAFASSSRVTVQDVRAAEVLHRLAGHRALVTCLDWSPDGQRLASGSLDWTVRISDVATRGLLSRIDTKGWIESVSWGPRGQELACVVEYDVMTFDAERVDTPVLRGHRHAVRKVQWSSDGERLLSAGYDNAQIWQLDEDIKSRAFGERDAATTLVSWSPDDERVACGRPASGP